MNSPEKGASVVGRRSGFRENRKNALNSTLRANLLHSYHQPQVHLHAAMDITRRAGQLPVARDDARHYADQPEQHNGNFNWSQIFTMSLTASEMLYMDQVWLSG